MKVIFTGGGTGGHVYPNIAIYEKIKEEYPQASFLYIGTKDGAEKRIVKNLHQPMDFVEVLSKGLPQSIRSFKTLIALFYILLGTIHSYFILKRFKPDIIIGSGGYVAAPVMFAASLLKLKLFVHEQNAVPGRLNRMVAKFATKIGVSFSSTAAFFPEDKVMVTGYPLRKSIKFSDDENIKEKYSIPEKNKVIFIFGGSRGAKTINSAIAELVPMLVGMEDITVILSTGRGYSNEYKAYDDTVKIFEDVGIPSEMKGRLIIREYFDNINEIYSITDLIISRAGAGTIKEITTLGIPSILIPKIDLPGDHQILNAREVQRIGGGKIVYEAVKYENGKRTIFVPETTLLNVIRETIYDSEALFNMRKNLRQVEKKNSTELILNSLESILKGKEKSEEEQLKIFYLQARDSENNIELVFDTTTIGNSYLCDFYLEDSDENILVKLKSLNKEEKTILYRMKGKVRVDDNDVETVVELNEGSKLELGGKAFVLKSYLEKVQKVRVEKSTTAKVLGSSFGIMFSRIGGLFREIFIAAYFGASKATDIFAIGLTIAYFMRRIVAENALENAFLPIFSRIFHRTSRKKTWEAASSITNFTILLSLIFTVLGVILAPMIITLLFPGFAEKGMTQETVNMTRLILPYLFLVTIAAVMTTYLKAFNSFGIAEASSIFFSIGIIAGILAFRSVSGLYSLAYGVLLGGVMQILFLFPFISSIFKMKSMQFSYKLNINFDNPFNKKYYAQLAPITLDVLLSKTAEIVGKVLAAGLHTGCIAYLHFSMAIYRLPFAIVSQALNSVILKEFSEKIALFDKERAKRLFLDGIKTNVFLLTPISILMIVLAKPIVSLLLQRGSFDAQMVDNTAYALQFYSLGLIGWGVHSLTVRIFSARLDIKTSMILNFFMLAVNVGLSIYLVKTSLTFAGLALATSLSFLIFSVIRIAVLKYKLGKEHILLNSKELLLSFFKTLLAASLMVIVLVEAKFVFKKIDFNSMILENIVLLISLSFIGISIYLLASLMLKNTELLIFKKKLRTKSAEIPVSMLSPFRFLEKVSRDIDTFKDDYMYKINIYLSSGRWEIRNVGVKLIGVFKDKSKTQYLVDILTYGKENGFLKRNAVISLRQLNAWSGDIKKMLMQLLQDSYFEVRVAALNYMSQCSSVKDYSFYKEVLHQRMQKSAIEEKLALLRLIAKIGDREELDFLEDYYLSSNSLIREELLQLLHSFYRRKILSAEEIHEHMQRILITSNNMLPEFKLKSILKKIYKEIE
ncbi:MAG: murein biosynthesis integral membrane protein MurJ [bacterium]|nr:murein biosynthesis integral membrane protein MurJ [bacterium]